jgi:hypothetical protein
MHQWFLGDVNPISNSWSPGGMPTTPYDQSFVEIYAKPTWAIDDWLTIGAEFGYDPSWGNYNAHSSVRAATPSLACYAPLRGLRRLRPRLPRHGRRHLWAGLHPAGHQGHSGLQAVERQHLEHRRVRQLERHDAGRALSRQYADAARLLHQCRQPGRQFRHGVGQLWRLSLVQPPRHWFDQARLRLVDVDASSGRGEILRRPSSAFLTKRPARKDRALFFVAQCIRRPGGTKADAAMSHPRSIPGRRDMKTSALLRKRHADTTGSSTPSSMGLISPRPGSCASRRLVMGADIKINWGGKTNCHGKGGEFEG